jgi:phage tail protein X
MGRYTNIPRYNNDSSRSKGSHIGTVRYPDIPLRFNDIYVYSQQGDRFDILAQDYYGDANLWWIISLANPQLSQNSYFPPVGIQLRIPTQISTILSNYNELNNI